MSVASDVPENAVHALEAGAGADPRVVVVRHRVEEGDTLALLQNLVVSGSEKAVGKTIPDERQKNPSITVTFGESTTALKNILNKNESELLLLVYTTRNIL